MANALVPTIVPSFEPICERIEAAGHLGPNEVVPPGHFGIVTYAPVRAGGESLTEHLQAGDVVRCGLAGGQYRFARGMLFRLAPG